jgi:hypothetical protein
MIRWRKIDVERRTLASEQMGNWKERAWSRGRLQEVIDGEGQDI